MDWLARILTLMIWLGVAVLLLLLYRIAFFYEVSAKQPTHYRWFVAPIILLSASGLRYALVNRVVGDVIGDSLLMLGGVMLIWLGMRLLRQMTGGRR